MVYTPVEIIALILIVFVATKMVVILVNPMAWMNFARKLYSNTKITKIVALILAAVILYYLLQEITIVQILAVTAFISMILVVGLAPHIERFMKKYRAQAKRGNVLKENLLYTLIWIALLIWGAKELFF